MDKLLPHCVLPPLDPLEEAMDPPLDEVDLPVVKVDPPLDERYPPLDEVIPPLVEPLLGGAVPLDCLTVRLKTCPSSRSHIMQPM